MKPTWRGPNPNIATCYGFYAAAILKGYDESHEAETGVSNDMDAKENPWQRIIPCSVVYSLPATGHGV